MNTDYGRFRVEPYSPHLGGEVIGVDLGTYDSELVKLIHDAWMDWKVLFFRDQDITADQHMAFAFEFGEVDYHPYLDVDGPQEIAVIDNPAAPESHSPWHSDATFRDCPPYASFLIARVLPPAGGDTCWANMELAYEGLSDDVKAIIEGRTATHSVRKNFARRLSGAALEAELERFPEQHHPIVRTHPVTGKRCLYVSAVFTDHIDDLESEIAGPLLDHLVRQVNYVEYQVRFRWRVNSLVMWDNRCTQHAPVYDYGPHRRRVERVTLAGDRPA